MSDPASPSPDPNPRYRTVQFRVPVWSPRAVAIAVVVALLALGAVGLAGWSGYQRHAAAARLAEARQEFSPALRALLDHDRDGLTQVESDLLKLNQTLDQGLAAKASKAVDVNSYAATQHDLAERLHRIEADLASLEAKEAAVAQRYRLPSDVALLSDAEQGDLATLRDRRKADATQVADLDTRIAAVARHRETLAQAEADDAKKARRAQELADARRMQAQAEGDTPSRDTSTAPSQAVIAEPNAYAPYYGDPYYPYPYGYDPYYYGYRSWGPSIIIGGGRGWGHHGHHR